MREFGEITEDHEIYMNYDHDGNIRGPRFCCVICDWVLEQEYDAVTDQPIHDFNVALAHAHAKHPREVSDDVHDCPDCFKMFYTLAALERHGRGERCPGPKLTYQQFLARCGGPDNVFNRTEFKRAQPLACQFCLLNTFVDDVALAEHNVTCNRYPSIRFSSN